MMPSSIAQLRRKFIGAASAAFLAVIVVMGVASFVSNDITLRREADRTIDAILDANGDTPGEGNFHDGPFHEESAYGLRFFTVTFDRQGNVTNVDLSHVASVDVETALLAAEAASDPSTTVGLGRFGTYMYKEGSTADGSMAVFLDCAVMIANTKNATLGILLVAAATMLITFVLIVVISNRAIKPEVENAQRQQRFMTNASHELKTPIAVIRANTELTEMMSGETEWTQSTMRQVDRLDRLVRDLMVIVRGVEQGESDLPPEDANVSEVVSQAVDSFRSVAQQNGLGLEDWIDADIVLRCNPKSIEQLTCLLVDNAMKYCDAGGKVLVSFSAARIGRGCTLVVSNDYAAGADVDYQRFFDRFYREDESHENQQGYGIGLSVAESICKHYHGSIKASWKSGVISFTCVLKDAE